MIRPFLLSLGLAMTISSPTLVGQESGTSTWKGTLDAGGTKLRLEVKIITIGGKPTGQLRSLDQGNAKLKITEIKVAGETFSFSIPKIGAKFSGRYAENGSVAKGTFRQGGAKLPLTLTRTGKGRASAQKGPRHKLKEAWIGKLNLGIIQPLMQFRIVTLESGKTAAYFDSITEGRTGFEATWSLVGNELKFNVPKIKVRFRGTLNKERDRAEGTWSQPNRKAPLTLKKQAKEYDNVNVWKNRPQRPVGPFPYDAVEVAFKNKTDGLTLAGTLTLPKKPGRHPVVVLISGSGPQDRDETIMGHKPFLVLADYLTRRGIAVLRYDDRGTAKSTGKFGKATTEDFARDTSAAVEFLKSHDRIDATKMGLAGHSEGGLIAPMVVGLRDDVAFIVLLGATGVDGATISLSQTEALLRAAGSQEAEIKMALEVNRTIMRVATRAKPGTDFSKDLDKAIEKVIQTIPESVRKEAGENVRRGVRAQAKRLKGNWTRFFLSYDPRPALKNIKCPVLAIWGSKDLQVLPDLNLPEIKKALAAGGNKDFEIVELEGLNHLFQKCKTGAMNEYASIPETFNPLALTRIGDWIIEHTKAKQ